MERMTKRAWFEVLTNLVNESTYENKEGAIAFINHEVELLNRKSASHTMTKTQKENLVVVENIREVLRTFDRPVTITEMLTDERLNGCSNQKISALLRGMGENGTKEVVKTVDKKRSYFSLAE